MDIRERETLELKTLSDLLCKIDPNSKCDIKIGFYDDIYHLLIFEAVNDEEKRQYQLDKGNSNFLLEKYQNGEMNDIEFTSTLHDVTWRCHVLETKKLFKRYGKK